MEVLPTAIITAIASIVTAVLVARITRKPQQDKVEDERLGRAFDEALKWVKYGSEEMERQKEEIEELRESERRCEKSLRALSERLDAVEATAKEAHAAANGETK